MHTARAFASCLVICTLAACTRAAPPGTESSPLPSTDPVADTPTVPELEPPDPGPTRAVNDRDLLPAAVAAIDAAEREVRVAQFVIYGGSPVDELLGAVAGAADRGLRVRLLADEEGDETAHILDSLIYDGVEAKLDSREVVLHNKLIVADDVAIVGSHNWTWSALEANHEASVLVADPEVAAWYAAWFDAVWTEPAADPQVPALPRDDLQPLADREVIDAVLGCIDAATERIDAVMYAIAWDAAYPGSAVDQVLTAIEAARARGVTVEVVVDGSAWIVDNEINDAAVERLRAADVAVWWAPSSVTTHAKVLRCDDTVLVSDANWTFTGLELAHGTSLLANEPSLLAAYEAWTTSIRDASSPEP